MEVDSKKTSIPTLPWKISSTDDNCLLGIIEDDTEGDDVLGGWTFGQLFLR